MKRASAILIAVMVVILGAVFMFSGEETSEHPEQEIMQIGAILMLSGFGSDVGENSRKGIELAVQEINNAGGISGKRLEVMYQDNKGDNPKEAINAYHNLKQRGASIIIGPNWAPSGNALAPLVDNSTLLFSPSVGSETFASTHTNIFNLWPKDETNTQKLAEYVYQQGHTNVAVFGTQQEWELTQAQTFRDAFISPGGVISAFENPLASNTDLSTESLRIIESNPDAIVFTNHTTMAHATNQLRKLGSDKPFFSVNMWNPNIEAAQGALEGTIFSTHYKPDPLFSKKFEKHYGVKPDIPADSAYDVMHIIAHALQNTNNHTPQGVAEEIRKLTEWGGASGVSVFNNDGSVTKEIFFFQISGGNIVEL